MVAPTVGTIGVVSMNEYRGLPLELARSDAQRVTSRSDVDVVGWQEADGFHSVLAGLTRDGWDTATFAGGSDELAVSWRRSEFTLVSKSQRLLARGRAVGESAYPFWDTWVLTVTLRHRGSGRLLSVLDTHLPPKSENLEDPGHFRATVNAGQARTALRRLAPLWQQAQGRWVVGTGDYNLGHAGDVTVRPPGGISRDFAGRAVSSYDVLGTAGVQATHPVSGRRIDYVFAAADPDDPRSPEVRTRPATCGSSPSAPSTACTATTARCWSDWPCPDLERSPAVIFRTRADGPGGSVEDYGRAVSTSEDLRRRGSPGSPGDDGAGSLPGFRSRLSAAASERLSVWLTWRFAIQLVVEMAIVGALFGLYNLGRVAIHGQGAIARAHAVLVHRFEATVRLPSEAGIQQAVSRIPDIFPLANQYYDRVHFPLMLAFILWGLLFRPRRSTCGRATSSPRRRSWP